MTFPTSRNWDSKGNLSSNCYKSVLYTELQGLSLQREYNQRPSGWDRKNEGEERDPSGIKEVGRKLGGREEPDLA